MAGNVRGEVARREGGTGTGVAQASPRDVLRSLLDTNRAAITLSLPRGFSEDRFIRLLLTAANTNPQLFECDPMSFLAAGVHCATLGLEPNDARGLAYLVPFRNNGRLVVTPVIGYRGYLDLARRSGQVTSVRTVPVYRGDDFEYTDDQAGTTWFHRRGPNYGDDPAANITHVVADAVVSGDRQVELTDRRQLDRAKSISQTGRKDQGPWHDFYEEMARKTGFRRLARWLPMTVEALDAIASDERPLTIGEVGLAPIDEPAADEPAREAVETTATEKEQSDG